MNNVNAETMELELSRFNKSGNVYSPIPNNNHRRQHHHQQYPSNVTATSRMGLQHRQTSTPKPRSALFTISSGSIGKPQPLHNSFLRQSPKYSLSSYSLTPKKPNNQMTRQSEVQTVTGPLLVSTRFNVNLGTYTDTKSPGLANRIVQYSNDLQAGQQATHQAKYSSPGQFPIVQLYKRDHPILVRTPRRCTVRIAPPDIMAAKSTEANAILRDSFLQKIPDSNGAPAESEINTKSVLEALKEISRKRIHTNDDLEDINKRQRKCSASGIATSSDNTNKDGKRLRENTPPSKASLNSPSAGVTKKICVVNEIESSLSSTQLMGQGTKRKATNTLSSTNINKQRKITDRDQVSRCTQTGKVMSSEPVVGKTSETNQQTSAVQTDAADLPDLISVLRKAKKDKEELQRKEEANIDVRPAIKDMNSPVFDQQPLQVIKRNKLNALFASLNGEEPDVVPVPEFNLSNLMKSAENGSGDEMDRADTSDATPKHLHSILTKNKVKHDKHVTFAFPENDTDKPVVASDKPEGDNASVSTVALPATVTFGNSSLTTANSTSTTSAAPISFGGQTLPMFKSPTTTTTPQIIPPSFGAITKTTVANNTISTPAINNSSKPDKSPVILGQSEVTFGGSEPKSFGGLVPPAASKPAEAAPVATPQAPPTFNFGNGTTGTTTTAAPNMFSSAFSSPSLPASTLATANAPAINFGTTKPITFGGAATTAPAVSTPISFGSPASAAFTISFGATTTTSTGAAPASAATTASGMFSFKSDAKTAFPFKASPALTPKTTAGGFKFDLTKGAAPVASLDANKAYSFGGVNSATTAVAAVAPVTTNAGMFGSPSSAPLAFGTPKPAEGGAFGFGTNTTQNNVFGSAVATTSAPSTAFGTPQNVTFGATANQSGGFGSATTQSATFGTATPSIGFGTATTQSAFGVPSAPATFGTPSTPNVFGTPTTQNAFGSPAAPAFGVATTQAPAFGVASTQAPAFGVAATQPPAFGSATTQSGNAFGTFSSPATTTAANSSGGFGFGQTSTFSFGANGSGNNAAKPFAFGAPTTSATAAAATTASGVFGFGGAATGGAFGAPTTTTAGSTFGQSTNVFGSGSAFSAPASAPSVFGQQSNATPSFGTSQTNAFGVAPTQNVFGGSAPAPAAGTSGFGQAPTAFGAPATNSFGTGFGGGGGGAPQAGGFGSMASLTAPQQQGGVFAFGGGGAAAAAPVTTPGNAFPFGAPGAPKKPSSSYNFGAFGGGQGSGAQPGAAPAFGAQPVAPGFGAQAGPSTSFGAQPGAGGMFNIGSGSTAAKQRPMIKARRRN